MNAYSEYINSEACCSFTEFLLGDSAPIVEYKTTVINGKVIFLYRMYRCVEHYSFFNFHYDRGEWCKTKKEAKASYKAVLKQRRIDNKAVNDE